MSDEIYQTIFIGEAGVGKTSLIEQFLHQKFYQDIHTTDQYYWVRKNIKISGLNEIVLDIRDIPTNYYIIDLLKIFMKDVAVVFLVYDITSKESFEKMKSQWYGEIKKANNENAIVAIVANKNDLNEKREVNDVDGKAFAEEKGAFFISTSAKNGNGIQALFKNVIKKIFDMTLKSMKKKKKKKKK